jgi:hypothetical protein
MPYKKFPLLNRKIKTISINERKSLVHVDDFAQPVLPGIDFNSFLHCLPNFLGAKDLRELAGHVKNARRRDKPIMWAMGAHTIKVGLSPILIDLMERGWISSISVNGAFMIHDFEIALCGQTSEDVSSNLHDGHYGNTEETGLFLNVALKQGLAAGVGAGEAVGHYLVEAQFPYNHFSVLCNAYKLNIPVTVHPAIGTDFIHFHPNFDGAVTGALAERDFLLFSSIVSNLSGGGVFLNVGSAVVMPEVFLKAIAFCRAQKIVLRDFYSAVFDFIRHYRANENVAKRPVANGGKGYYFVGQHEIMIPLLAAVMLNS